MLYNRTFEGNRYKIFFPSTAGGGLQTFTIPAGVTTITVTIVGAGGAGGIGYSLGAGGGGGAGGALKVRATVVPGTIYNLTVPFGGTAIGGVSTAATGNCGLYPAASFFDSAVAYSGINGGSISGGSGSGGTGGSYFASAFWTILASQNGGNGAAGSGVGGDGGAFTTFQAVSGTFGQGDQTGSDSLASMSATGYGAGGGGSYNRSGVNAEAGTGANGYLRIEW